MATLEGATEREIGRIAGVMDTLKDGMADIKTDMQQGFLEVKNQIAKQSAQVDNEIAHMDKKIGAHETRISGVESWTRAHDERVSSGKSSWIARRMEKMFDGIFNALGLVVVAFIGWLVIEYIKRGLP